MAKELAAGTVVVDGSSGQHDGQGRRPQVAGLPLPGFEILRGGWPNAGPFWCLQQSPGMGEIRAAFLLRYWPLPGLVRMAIVARDFRRKRGA